jgi:hypothetical protein
VGDKGGREAVEELFTDDEKLWAVVNGAAARFPSGGVCARIGEGRRSEERGEAGARALLL